VIALTDADCELCRDVGGELLYQNAQLRVVWVDEPDYPGFCRVVWNRHVREMTDLAADDRNLLMSAVFVTESALRDFLQPDKINLASLGNVTPHLHWHVVPRFAEDRHFPAPIWAAPKRPPRSMISDSSEAVLKQQLKERLRALLG
jgi:diadenosine tetraphosphate (Ap4A) HIT family hydrolase